MQLVGQEREHKAHLAHLSFIKTGLWRRKAKYLYTNLGIGGGEGTEYFTTGTSWFVSISELARSLDSASLFVGTDFGSMLIMSQQAKSSAAASFDTAIIPVGFMWPDVPGPAPSKPTIPSIIFRMTFGLTIAYISKMRSAKSFG